MKNRLILLLLALSFVFCGCNLSPEQDKTHTDSSSKTFRVYVCGAVENEGYVTVAEGADVNSAIAIARLAERGLLPTYGSQLDVADCVVIVSFSDKAGKVCYPVNCNGIAVANKLPCQGVEQNAVDAVADYVAAHGTIRNKTQLKQALGELYSSNYFKFYVAEADYEAD